MANDNGDKMDIDPPPPNSIADYEKEDASKPNSRGASPEPEGQSSEPQRQQEQQPQLPESLIAGRARRSTAGNRLAALLDREAVEEDDIDLLFEENEDDDEFEGRDESDIELGSSSDEEDNNAGAGAGGAGNQGGDDELAGERELQREAKEEKAKEKKRRAAKESFLGQQQMKKLLGGSKKPDANKQQQKPKKVQIQEPHESSPVDAASPADSVLERQRKKSERISWIPTPEDKPSRQSSRRQTVANKKVTHQRLKEAEERRIKTINTMNEAMLRKKKDKQVVWTQEMRLEEAKKTEELNKKSLNKWEELELQRAEARKAKLEALHNRKLKGAMITFYSKAAEWQDTRKLVEEVDDNGAKETTGKKRGRPRLADKEGDKAGPSGKEKSSSDEGQKDVAMTDPPKEDKNLKAKEDAEVPSPKITETSPKEDAEAPSPKTTETSPKESGPSLSTTAEATPKDSEATPRDAEASPKETEASPNESESPPPKEAQPSNGDVQMEEAGALKNEAIKDTSAAETSSSEKVESSKAIEDMATKNDASAAETPISEQAESSGAVPPAASSQPAPKADIKDVGASIYIDPAEKIAEPEAVKHVPNISSRTFIILQNFDKEAIQTKEYQSKVLFPHNRGPIPKPEKPLCVVTNLPARFRDPATGLPYANLFAYKQIQRVRSGEIRWSNSLQCFVGVQTEAAAGVPEGFLMSE